MKFLNVLTYGPNGKTWLVHSAQPRILHVFERACNLTNERGEILSIVTRHIGNGPFNLVLGDDLRFMDHLDIESIVTVRDSQLQLGELTISLLHAKLWNPRPDWNLLHAKQEYIFQQLSEFNITDHQSLQSPISNSPASNFSSAFAKRDIPSAKIFASQLAGVGQGLTPSGDDFIMGALYAAWIIHPPEVAQQLTQEVAVAAAPLTTSLSAAWLVSAGKGEAGEVWHEFFDALLFEDHASINVVVKNILSVGATSGADALSGFVSTFFCDKVNIQHG